MSDETLWSRDAHTAAKHAILAAYVEGWYPVMAFQSLKVGGSKLLVVDGFAGPGTYSGGEQGSPLILIESLLRHSQFEKFEKVRFTFLLIEHDRTRFEHLQGQIEGLSLPKNVAVEMINGEFEESFGEIVRHVAEADGKTLVPTFAFIDPFGYSSASMSLTGKFLEFPRSEALFFLPLSFIQRFVGREGQDAAMTNLFNSDRWKDAIQLKGESRRAFLLDLFESQLEAQGGVRYVRSFRLVTGDGNDYRLVFATGHEKGLELMKSAMWKVDPIGGVEFRATTRSGQDVLFEQKVDTRPLLRELRAQFGDRIFTVDEAATVTLKDTPFLPSSHLKRLTLQPAERAGIISVERPEGARSGTFGDAVKIRFVLDPQARAETRR